MEALGADVIAIQEIESRAAAERVFDPSVYTVVMEERVGTTDAALAGGARDLRSMPSELGSRSGRVFRSNASLISPPSRSAIRTFAQVSISLSGRVAANRSGSCPST